MPNLQIRQRLTTENSRAWQPVAVVHPWKGFKTTIPWRVHSLGHWSKDEPWLQCHRRWCNHHIHACPCHRQHPVCPVDSKWQDRIAFVFTSRSLSTRILQYTRISADGGKNWASRKTSNSRSQELLLQGTAACHLRAPEWTCTFEWGFGRYLETNQDVAFIRNDDAFIASTLKPGEWATVARIALSASLLATSMYVWHGQSQRWVGFHRHQTRFDALFPRTGSILQNIYIVNKSDHYKPVYWV